jgi:acyl-CoA thioesterase I
MLSFGTQGQRCGRRRRPTYGGADPRCQRGAALRRAAAALMLAVAALAPGSVQAKALQIVAFGDSLMAGFNLPPGDDFPARLAEALRRDGVDVAITNASVSGDTTSGGLDRLDWSVPDGTDGVLLELGANDMLRGQDPATTQRNLEAMVGKLKARGIAVYLLGMKANPTLGADFVGRFDAIYPDLAKADELPLDPFFLDGVAGQSRLQLSDGMHPNPDGVAVMVARVEPGIAAWLKALAGRKE